MNKSLILLLLLALCGCAKDYSRLSFLDQYESKPTQDYRMPAKIGQDSCFIDEFGIDRIKNEIKALEKTYTTRVEVPSEYNFSSFNAAETHYIKRFHEYIYLADDSNKCESLPCVLNKAYGDDNGEEGYRIYHWFLTMGSGISTLDKIPGYSRDENRARKDYLFPNKELKLLNMVSSIISEDYRNILVSTIHRFPNGTSPGLLVAGQYQYSYGNKKNPGTIFLTDQDVRFDTNSNLIHGHYIETVIHELSHALDFTYGKNEASEHFSGYDDWVQLSWKWGEGKTRKYRVVDGVREEFEVIEMKWIVDEEKAKKEGFVEGYQRTSHKEDFADANAHFVVRAEKMKKISPKKLKVISESFYQSTSFLDESEIKSAEEFLLKDFSEAFWEQLKECSLDETTQYRGSSLVFPRSVRMLKSHQKKCIETKVSDHLTHRLKLHFKQRYLGCSVIKDKEDEVIQNSINTVSSLIDSAIDEIGGLDNIKETWKKLRDDLAQNCSPVTIYLKNRKSDQTQYDKEIKSCSLEQLQRLSESHSIFDDEVESYVNLNSFDKAKKDTVDKFILMSKGLESTFPERTTSDINACKVYRDEPLATTIPIDGGTVFVQASVLNCLNENFTQNYDETIKLYLQDKYNISSLGLEFITELYMQKYIDASNISLLKISESENIHYEKYFLDNSSDIFEDEINNEEILIEYFRYKKYSLLKSSIEKKIHSLFESRGGYPITISTNQLINKLIEKLEGNISLNANKKAATEIQQVNKYVENKSLNISNGDLSMFDWSIDKDQQFNVRCENNITKIVRDTNYDSVIKYYSQEKIKSDLVLSTCEHIQASRNSDLASFDKTYENSKLDFIGTNLQTNWKWKLVDTSSELLTLCLAKISSTESEFSASVFFDVHAVKLKKDKVFCELVVKNWENEKNLVSEAIACDCNIEKPNDSLAPTNWTSYIEHFSSYASLSLINELKDALGEEVESCKAKYPRPRYSLMKIKRKKCLLAITEEKISINIIGFDKLKTKLAKELIHSLSENINEHMN